MWVQLPLWGPSQRFDCNMKFLPLPDYSELSEYLAISTDSPSGLVWIKGPARCIKPGQVAGSLHKSGYWDVAFRGITYKAHRLIFLLQHKEDPCDMTVDHVDGKEGTFNLRLATHSQNSHNRKKTKQTTTSKYKGVFWCKQKKKWKARIYVNKKQHWLGYFETEEEAASKYNEAASNYLKSFSKLNEITDC